MNKEKVSMMAEMIKNLKTDNMELISTYEEGYIGKKVYRVTLSDGTSRMCEQITKRKGNGDAVVIIPITYDGEYVMIIESRPNIKETVALEFPAGMIDEGENPLEAAKRELLEETGYQAENLYELEWHYQDQGCSKAVIRTFVAEGCKKMREQSLDGNEKLKPIRMSYGEILELIKSDNYVNDANSKIAFMNYTLKKKGLI